MKNRNGASAIPRLLVRKSSFTKLKPCRLPLKNSFIEESIFYFIAKQKNFKVKVRSLFCTTILWSQ